MAPSIPEHEIDRYVESYRGLPRTGRDERPPHKRVEPLTDQQTRVLELAAAGLLRKQTALAMGISEETVRNHLSRGRYRLGAKTTAQAIAIALRRGLIS